MKFKILLFFIFSFFHIYSSNVEFFSVNSIHGITMRETSSICKDENGFIWTSSKTGVLRLSNDDYRIYQLPYAFPDVIWVKLIYENLQLYAYTNNGQLFQYDRVLDRFNFLVDLKELSGKTYITITQITLDKQGSFWVASTKGLYRYKDARLEVVDFDDTDVTSIAFLDKKHLFFATNEDIRLLNMQTYDTEILYSFEDIDSGIKVSKFYFDDKANRLWMGTNARGLYFYDIDEDLFQKISATPFPKQPILAIESNTDSTLLVGVDGQGIWEISRAGDKVLNVYKEDVNNPFSLRGDGVYDIFCDDDRRVWVSTHSGGLSFLDQELPVISRITHKINTTNSLGNNHINQIIEDRRGNIWFATNNGISRWNPATNKWSIYYQNKQEQARVFLALCEDNDGNIWAGTYSSGVYVIDGKTGNELKHYSYENANSLFLGRFIFDIYKDSDGDIWIGGVQSPITCYFAKEKAFRTYTNQPVRAFLEFEPGKILLICSYALIMLDKEKKTEDFLLSGYLSQDALVINNDIWLGTSGDGLIHFDYKTKEKTKYTVESGLLSNYINSIAYANGYLWLGTENGLCRFNPVDKSVLSYSSVSLSDFAFNINAKVRLKNGDLLFGTNNGAIMLDPNMLYQTRLKGNIFFQDISILGRSIRENPELMRNIPVNEQEEILLRHNQNTLALEVLPIGVASSGSKFSWKLEGLDADWNAPSNLQVITYTNIPSGDFQLKIRMYDNSLSQIIDERTLDIYVTLPYWKTIWFRLLIGLVVVALVIFLMKLYINNLEQRHTEDKIRFFTNTAHDIRTSLTLIGAPIEELNKEKNLSEKGRFYLNMAMEQSDRLSFVATQLLDFQKVDVGKGQVFWVMTDIVNLVFRRKFMFDAAARRKDVELVFVSNVESFVTAVDELKIEKVVDNLISNAIKYSHQNSKVEITLNCGGGKWELKVKDYGLGISENSQSKLFREFYRGDNAVNSKMVGSGIGLLLVRNYIVMHGGNVSLESKENVGSTFKITVPYKETDDFSQSTNPVCETLDDSEINIALDISDTQKTENALEKKAHILVVEDNNDLQNFLKYSLQENYMVSIANDGVEGWNFIQKKMPDLVISDIMMPNMDGFELCRLIKSKFETSHIPVILLTALSEKTQQLEGLGLGADDYITKPFDMTLLSQRIKTIVRNREIVREKALKLIKQPDDEQAIFANELNDQFVKKALEVVRANMANSEFGKEEFASAMNASSSLLYKKVKALTGQSPIDFIKSIRLDYSLELLRENKYTITEVSEMCGFSSVGYFSTVFKKYFGKPPTEMLN